MKILNTREGFDVMVDDDAYEEAKNLRWELDKDGYVRSKYPFQVYLHRAVMGNPHEQVDHIDRNLLNCQRSNLRVATPSQNGANRKRRTGGTSQYKGVYSYKRTYKGKEYLYWACKVKKDGKEVFRKNFKTEIEAAKAYDIEAEKAHGEFAYKNFPTL